MAEADFFQKASKARVTEAVKAFEAKTSAELVVAVRHTSGSYRQADFAFGAIVGLAVLCVLLFYPTDFAIDTMPLEVAAGFALGAVTCAYVGPLRRLLTSGKVMRENVHNAACAAFVRLGVSRCTGRNGILVFVSTFEKQADVVCDTGIDPKALGEPWARGLAEVTAKVSGRADFDGFVRALEALGPIIGAAMPRQADDVNELPDEVDAA